MKVLLRLISVFVLITVFASNTWANTPKILQLKDLESGTHAIGFSVFKGVEPEPFNVVLGEITERVGNNFILAKIYGKTSMDTPLEKIGAISGMSGSPVFVGCNDLDDCISNGTLVGALSYAVGYFIQGGVNCLLTPAEYMLGARTGGYVASSNFSNGLPNKISIGGKDFYNLMLFPKMENLRSVAEGFGGVRSVAGSSSGRCNESVKSDIKPGSMITVFLATGSINFGASGTVTWRDEDKIYVFGHLMLRSGMVSYPFVQVSVADTIQTPFGASKIAGCYLDTKGEMLVDGAFEMAGVIGRTASVVPYQVELRLGDEGAILFEEIAMSPLASAVIQQLPIIWAQQLLGDLSKLSLAYHSRISIADQPEIFVRNFIPVQVSEDPFGEVFNNVYLPIQTLRKSGFNYKIDSIKVHLEVIKDFKLWTVKKSFLSQEKTVPGETVYANIVLEEFFSSATKQISVPIKVPADFMERIKSGTPPVIKVLIQGSRNFIDKRVSVETTSIEDVIKQLNQQMNHKTNVFYVQQIMPKLKADQDADLVSAKTSVKPAWKWTDIGEDDLKQFPDNDKNEIVLTLSPTLNNFIDLNLTFNLIIQPKKEVVDEKKDKEPKHRKWYLLFLL